MNDLKNNFASINGGVFHVNDSVVVATSIHNLVQLSSKTCGAILSGGLQCCNVGTNNNCGCPSSSFTITFSTAGLYFFECALTGHCSGQGLLGQINFTNPTIVASSSHHNATSSVHNATSSNHNATSSVHNATSSHHNATSSHKNTTSSQHNNGETFHATIFDLSNNFAGINGGIFHVNDMIIVDTTGGHNMVQLTNKSCGSPYLLGGLQCCNVTVNNNCPCPNSTYTLKFSTAGIYFFECALTGHCSTYKLLGQLTILSASSQPSGAERLSSGLNLLFVASFILFVKFFKIF